MPTASSREQITGRLQITTERGTVIIVRGTTLGESSPTQPVKPGITAEISGTAVADITVNAASTIEMFGTATPFHYLSTTQSVFGR